MPKQKNTKPQRSEVRIECAFDEMVEIGTLTPHPKNPNQHPKPQVDILAKLISRVGWRAPIAVSKRSGFVVRGHGRLLAAKQLGLATVPVDFQNYDSEEQELQDLVADNQIPELSETSDDMLREVIESLGTFGSDAFDFNLLGFDDVGFAQFMTKYDSPTDPKAEWDGMPEFDQPGAEAFRSINIHFADQAAVDLFAKVTNLKLSDKAKYAWFPEQEIDRVADLRYESTEK